MNRLTTKSADGFNDAHVQKKRWHKIVTALSCLVVFCTTYALIMPAITMTGETFCGKQEHIHTQACFTTKQHEHTKDCYKTESVLICGQDEVAPHQHSEKCYSDGELVCTLTEGEGHVHSKDCYETQKVLVCNLEEGDQDAEEQLICGKEEHQHSQQCYSDPSATESQDSWTKDVPELTGHWSDDVAAVAKSQLGYAESKKNFQVDENDVIKGYTRYGAWYGGGNGSQYDYADWDAIFVSFCLNFAGIPNVDAKDSAFVPQDNDCLNWIKQLKKVGIYKESGYTPVVGDLVFFDTDQDSKADHVGIVESRDCDKNGSVVTFTAIEGDVDDAVVQNTYDANDSTIIGYCALPANPALKDNSSEDDSQNNKEADTDADNSKSVVYASKDANTAKASVDVCNLTLSLKLNWPDKNNKKDVTLYLVNQNTGERVETITINTGSTDETIPFTNLPRVDADGNEIQYGIEMETVSGYVGGYDISTTDSTNTWDENSTLWVKASKIEAGKSYLLLTSDEVGPGNSQYIRADSTIVPTNMLSKDIALSAGPITAANGNSYTPYLKADANGVGGALWKASKSGGDGFAFESNYLTEEGMPGYYLQTKSSLDNNKKATKWKFKDGTITYKNDTLYPFEKVDPVYGTVRNVNMNVELSYTSIGQAEENWQEYTTIKAVKQWQDANGNIITEGLPDSLKVTLTADGQDANVKDASVTLNAENNWTYEWSVPRYSFDSGLKKEIKYSVKEESADGFTLGETKEEDVYGDKIIAWVLTDDFEDNGEYILTTSPNTGSVGALTASSNGAHWANGKQENVTVKSGSLTVNGVTYNQYIPDPPSKYVIWKTGTGKQMTANQHGTHKMWTLYNEAVRGYLKNNGQGDISSDVKQECWFYYNWNTGTPGKRPPSNPSSEWSNVLGSYNDYFLLSNNHTGDGGATTAQTFWLYKKVEAQPVVHQITLVNQKSGEYELPETGGSGTLMYTIGGLFIVAGSLLCWRRIKYRRERRY